MDLSSIIGYNVKPYLEFAWVTAPNASGQVLTYDTTTVLTLNTKVADTGGFGSLTGNIMTLSAGTYAYNIALPLNPGSGPGGFAGVVALSSSFAGFISRFGIGNPGLAGQITLPTGQFTVPTQQNYVLTCWVLGYYNSGSAVITNSMYGGMSTSQSTAGYDQRTTIRLWKLA